MSILSGVSDFFGLDIGTTAIRAVQLSGGGPVKSLVKYAYIHIDVKVAQSESTADRQKLIAAIQELLAQATITTSNVVVGLPSQRVFTTVVDFDRLAPGELAKASLFEAYSLIPLPLIHDSMD